MTTQNYTILKPDDWVILRWDVGDWQRERTREEQLEMLERIREWLRSNGYDV